MKCKIFIGDMLNDQLDAVSKDSEGNFKFPRGCRVMDFANDIRRYAPKTGHQKLQEEINYFLQSKAKVVNALQSVTEDGFIYITIFYK